MIRRSLRNAAAALIVAATAASANTALACWDGYAASVGDATLQRSTSRFVQWNQQDARLSTLWARRIDALLPDGVKLAYDGYLHCSGEKCPFDLDQSLPFSASFGEVFVAVANAFGSTANQRGAALLLEQPLYTVQVFSGWKETSLAYRDRLNAMSLGDIYGGIFAEGGFPSFNAPVHAIADGANPNLVRVIVEVYGDVASAKAAEAELRRAGIEGFVTELPYGTPLDERVYGRGE